MWSVWTNVLLSLASTLIGVHNGVAADCDFACPTNATSSAAEEKCITAR